MDKTLLFARSAVGQSRRGGRGESNGIELPKSGSVHLYTIRFSGQFQRLRLLEGDKVVF